jgi:uncharacterized protein (TIGR02594 family)
MAAVEGTPTVANPVIREILRQGRKRPRKHVKAALQTGKVESNFTNVGHGDADSVNWRQERASIYGGDMSIRRSVRRFYQEAAQHDAQGKKAWQLAADVQRPAAQYRTRYRDAAGTAESILRGKSTGRGGGGGGRRPAMSGSVRLGRPDVFNMSRQTSFDEAGYKQAQRRSIVAQMLQRSGRGGSLFRTGVLSTQAPDPGEFTSSRLVSSITPGTNSKLTWSQGAGGSGGGGTIPAGAAGKAVKAARNRLGISEVGTSNRGERIDKWQKRYGMIGQPWCGIFVGTVLRRAGVQTDSRIASVAAIEAMGRNKEGAFRGFKQGAHGARRGDLLITRKGQHVAFIERVGKDGTIHTIGGNESGRVQRASYKPGTVYGSVRVRYRG